MSELATSGASPVKGLRRSARAAPPLRSATRSEPLDSAPPSAKAWLWVAGPLLPRGSWGGLPSSNATTCSPPCAPSGAHYAVQVQVRQSCLTIFLGASLFLTGCSSADQAGQSGLLLVPSVTFDGAEFREDLAVLIEGDEIVEVGDADDLRSQADEVRELPDSTLLPGFIDLHVHLGAVGSYSELPAKGVTTVRDVGINESALPIPSAGGLEVFFAGPLITVPGGYPVPIHGKGVEAAIEGAQEAREQVAELVELGASVIKIALTDGSPRFDWPSLSQVEVESIVEEAHAHKVSVTAHVSNKHDVLKALDAGVDEWAHMPCWPVPEPLLKRAADQDVSVVATLHVHERCPAVLTNAQGFLEAGGVMLYGSDVGNAGIPFGVDIRELELMMDAGMTLEEVLASATSTAGGHLGLAPLGTISAGAPADLMVIEGDVRESLDGFERPSLVVVDGELLED